MLSYIIGLLILILPNNAIANIGNEQIELAHIAYQEAVRNEIDPVLFLKLIACESGFSKSALGDYQIETDSYISRGLLQFQKPTFYEFSKLYGLNNLEWMNPKDQITLSTRMLSNGLWKKWFNCWRSI